MPPVGPNSAALILVTGPARSGKSEWAERLAEEQPQGQVIYVATAQLAWSAPDSDSNSSDSNSPDPEAHTPSPDPDWLARIQQHQMRRPANWKTQEPGPELGACIRAAHPTDCLLIDSLGTWLVHFLDQPTATWVEHRNHLLESLRQRPCSVIMVAEETGWGVVPAYPSGRCFRDRLGELTRQIGTIADTVYLVTGGYALNLSQLGTLLPPPR